MKKFFLIACCGVLVAALGFTTACSAPATVSKAAQEEKVPQEQELQELPDNNSEAKQNEATPQQENNKQDEQQTKERVKGDNKEPNAKDTQNVAGKESRNAIAEKLDALTESQKAELEAFNTDINNIYSNIIDKYAEYGVLDEETASALKAELQERSGGLPFFKGGRPDKRAQSETSQEGAADNRQTPTINNTEGSDENALSNKKTNDVQQNNKNGGKPQTQQNAQLTRA